MLHHPLSRCIIAVAALLLLAVTACSRQEEEPGNDLPVSVTEPGTLDEIITPDRRPFITELTIAGSLNEADIAYIRQMPELRYLDLSAVSLPDNFLPENAFANHEALKEADSGHLVDYQKALPVRHAVYLLIIGVVRGPE